MLFTLSSLTFLIYILDYKLNNENHMIMDMIIWKENQIINIKHLVYA